MGIVACPGASGWGGVSCTWVDPLELERAEGSEKCGSKGLGARHNRARLRHDHGTYGRWCLVASVMQVVAFTGDFIRLCRTTFEDGTPEPGAASNAAHFAALLSTLRDNISNFDPIHADAEGSNETLQARNRLRSLASDLARDTKELQGVLRKVTTTASSGASSRLKAVLAYKFYYKGLISSLEKRIDGTRNVMNSEFLSRICSSAQAAHARSEERYTGLREDMKLFIDRWSDGKRTISELVSAEAQATRALVTSEAVQTRGRIDLLETRLVTRSSRHQAEETKERVLSTLWFREMNERENAIEEASYETVKWVFSEERLANGEKCQFAEWLKSDQSVFWISGKPGSGKSTLMKFLLRDRRTTEYLGTWKTPVQICSFFFFELGANALQKQLRGCCRTLLHQILDGNPTILETMLQKRPELSKKLSEHDWSLGELSGVLQECLSLGDSAFCLFLDGLDEIVSEERDAAVKLVGSLGRLPTVKICASSRPENLFRRYLGCYPMLRVQDLTYDAIRTYAEDRLKEHVDYLHAPDKAYEPFLSDLARRSEGVFLWAAIAIKDLLRSMHNLDTWPMLCKQLEEFPPSLNGLYKQMWNKQNEDWPRFKEEAAEIFWLVLNLGDWYDFRELEYLIATHQELRKELQRLVTTQGYYSSEDEMRISETYEAWLSARSCGLVEIIRASKGPPFGARVDFVHRSACEFLQNTDDGRQLLSSDCRSRRDKLLAVINASRISAYIWATRCSDEPHLAELPFQEDHLVA
ncbi:hypothetical protein DL767_005791 [Monosporascus sp. MG133]|nr:hypothetical protein DL767_005791 [Monosporascus sp. MG133]